jgi:hypothetical protein
MGVGLQPAVAALLMLAQPPLPVVRPVDLLGGHREPTRHPTSLVAAPAQPAKHARGLAAARLLGGGQGLLAVDGGPLELAGAVAGRLVEQAAQPVPLGPQLGRGQPLEIGLLGVSIASAWLPARDQSQGQAATSAVLFSPKVAERTIHAGCPAQVLSVALSQSAA